MFNMACVFKTEFSVNILKLRDFQDFNGNLAPLRTQTSTHMIMVFWDSQMGGKKALKLPASHLCFCIPTWLPVHNNRTTDPNRLL